MFIINIFLIPNGMVNNENVLKFLSTCAFRGENLSSLVAGLCVFEAGTAEEILRVNAVEEVHEVFGNVADQFFGGFLN
jgi:hypothetical protein